MCQWSSHSNTIVRNSSSRERRWSVTVITLWFYWLFAFCCSWWWAIWQYYFLSLWIWNPPCFFITITGVWVTPYFCVMLFHFLTCVHLIYSYRSLSRSFRRWGWNDGLDGCWLRRWFKPCVTNPTICVFQDLSTGVSWLEIVQFSRSGRVDQSVIR